MNGQINITKTQIWLIVVAVSLLMGFAVLCTYLLTKQNHTKKVIEVLERGIQSEREARKTTKALADSLITMHTRSANVSLTKARSNETYYREIPKKMQAVADSVDQLNDDELRRAFAEF